MLAHDLCDGPDMIIRGRSLIITRGGGSLISGKVMGADSTTPLSEGYGFYDHQPKSPYVDNECPQIVTF